MPGAYSEFFSGRGHQISSLFQAQIFPGRVILNNLSNKNDFRGSGGMLPRKIFENLHTVMQGRIQGVDGVAHPPPPPPLKYKLIYICSQRNRGNRTSEDALTFFFFSLVWSSLILGGKLDVEKREDLVWSSPIFSVETCRQEIAALPFQTSGHVPVMVILAFFEQFSGKVCSYFWPLTLSASSNIMHFVRRVSIMRA